jgi:hypothetical protein
VAIEAKYTEPRYETVEQWLGTSPTLNRQAVLAGWLAHIAARSDSPPLDPSVVLGLPYQLVQRVGLRRVPAHPRGRVSGVRRDCSVVLPGRPAAAPGVVAEGVRDDVRGAGVSGRAAGAHGGAGRAAQGDSEDGTAGAGGPAGGPLFIFQEPVTHSVTTVIVVVRACAHFCAHPGYDSVSPHS